MRRLRSIKVVVDIETNKDSLHKELVLDEDERLVDFVLRVMEVIRSHTEDT